MSAARPSPPTDHDVAIVHAQLACVIGSVSRVEIGIRTGMSDRTVREAVSELVNRGVPVVTDRSAGGYELTRDRGKIEAEVRRLKSAASRILERAQALESHLR